MPTTHNAGHEGLKLGRHENPGLKEMTIELGDSDIYINMSKRVNLEGHTLFEAIMTDAHGSRVIFIDKEEIVDCLQDSFIQPPDAARGPPGRRG